VNDLLLTPFSQVFQTVSKEVNRYILYTPGRNSIYTILTKTDGNDPNLKYEVTLSYGTDVYPPKQYIKSNFVQFTNTGTDLPNQATKPNPMNGTLLECQTRCENEPNCIGFSREKSILDNQTGVCYLKQSAPGLKYNNTTWNTYVKPEKMSSWIPTTTTQRPILPITTTLPPYVIK